SPAVYLALCGLVRDAMEVDSDAAPLLQQAFDELSGVAAGGMIPSELTEDPDHLTALRQGGFLRG
ncbi:MAG: hypothetical protein HGA90_03395, partial [Alphaproteobacteria bacterium]|nr:hypothetical protein [Alphaproteobacteria bacterium]